LRPTIVNDPEAATEAWSAAESFSHESSAIFDTR